MQFTNIFLRGDIMFSFRDYLCIQKLLRNFLCESELANNEFDYYELPIKDGTLTTKQLNTVKEVMKNFLENFNLEIQNKEYSNDKQNQTDDVYLNLCFGVILRDKNLQFCTYENGEFFKPEDMNDSVALKILANLNKIRYLKGKIKKDYVTNLYSIAYETTLEIDGIGEYEYKNKIKLYLKFDFRNNTEKWFSDDYNNRHTTFDNIDQKTLRVPKSNSKVCVISLHNEEY